MAGFDDLEEAVEEQDSDGTEDTATTEMDTTETSEDVPTEPDRDQTQEPDRSEREKAGTADSSSSADSTSESEGDIHQKAFSYAEAKQSPIYARQDAWKEYNAAMQFDTERELHDRGVDNVDKRELHEAMLRHAAKHPEQIAEEVLKLRREG
jgi:hypothetical protein